MSFRGIMPKPTRNKDETSDFSQMRTVLRESWNTSYQRQLGGLKRVLTPFRAVNNAGDILCRQNYSCGGPNSGYQSRAGLRGSLRSYRNHFNSSLTPFVFEKGS